MKRYSKLDIIFTGGASPYRKPIEPTNLGKLYDLIFQKKDSDERCLGAPGARYSNKVLTGNWYEERAVAPSDAKTEWMTVYREFYKPHELGNSREEAYERWKTSQKAHGEGREIDVDEDPEMLSSYDLNYEIGPRGLDGPRPRVYRPGKGTWESEGAIADEVTKDDLDHASEKKIETFDPEESVRSSYEEGFAGKNFVWDNSATRFPKHGLDLNTPDLRHLGFDLSSSKPPYREPQFRDTPAGNICTWLS